ncbi:hypothetical protein EPUS_01192 [Endocarpon pusillum Z07020]|uniref:PNPLA domain-containing protein n=1 Tax=Endocarpon pusillum (strain Z07020 / HMAS-L-300199) TaxID=1263415 RepID=U1HGH8_ENDPU|nr:uncharacterized protein EPUS_01192 [Endocarpon pusillum Z07020]ERF69235.1 hypothetical protein EPUS_01192 [Endocarpon pusillum Z07020]
MASAHGLDAQSETTLGRSQTGSDHTLDNTGSCLLSLDGGGVRGLSTLYILQGIMNRLNYMREQAALRPRKPCEIFDLIGGTSTGGLIAIMLGRLEMSVEECITAYTKMMKHVFEKKANHSFISILGGVKPRFSSKALENAILQVLKERGIRIDEKFENGTRLRCKVFVCTKFQKTNTTTRLRSYRIPAVSDFNPTILEAALATSAAPTYFSDVAIEGSRFVDGALGANNPALEVEEEATDLWCEETGNLQPLVKCFISVGTGHAGIRSVSDKGLKHLLETLQKEASETESTNQKFLGRWRNHVEQGRCFRFNVDHGLDNVGLAEFEEQDLLRAATSTYLQKRAELISLGNTHLKLPPNRITRHDLLNAQQNFSQALNYLKNNPSTPPKQVSRLCHRLMETSIRLSMIARESTERKQHADQGREYAEKALDNARKCEDDCMVAQAEFMLACVGAWKVYVAARMSRVEPSTYPKREGAEVLLEQRLEELGQFPHLDMEVYEAQARKYLGYLRPR